MIQNKKFILVSLFIIVFIMAGCNQQPHSEKSTTQQNPTATDTTAQPASKQPAGEVSGQLKDGWREVKVEAFQFGFEPEEIVVLRGEKVRLRTRSTDVTHGLGLKAYNINRTLPPEEETIIEFTADRAGEFHIHCTVYCGSGHSDMHAMLKVKEPQK